MNSPKPLEEKKKSSLGKIKKVLKKVGTGGTPKGSDREGKESKLGSLIRSSFSSSANSSPRASPRGSSPSSPKTSSPYRGGIKAGEEDKHARGSPLAPRPDGDDSAFGKPDDVVSVEAKSEDSPNSSGARKTHASPGKGQSPGSARGPSPGQTNLATLPEPGSGRGTALPFGEQSGKVEGYSTLPDPQGEHYSKLAAESRGGNRGGNIGKALLSVALIGAVGAAGVYISSRVQADDDSGKKKSDRKRSRWV